MNGNVLIEASAGTGKTFTLVSHLVRLLLTGVKPSSIVALTFSRAAAGEIFDELMLRLAQGTQDDSDESFNNLLKGVGLSEEIRERMASLKRPYKVHFAKALRSMINEQHLSMIGTIDSFMMRILQMFPMEVGIQDDIGILDDWQQMEARNVLVGKILGKISNEDKRIFQDAFRMAQAGEEKKSYVQTFLNFAKSLHDLYLDFPEEGTWSGFVSKYVIFDENEAQVYRKNLVERMEALQPNLSKKAVDGWSACIDFVRANTNGKYTKNNLPSSMQNAELEVTKNLAADNYEFSINRIKTSFFGEGADVVRDMVLWTWGSHIAMKMIAMRGLWKLMNRFVPEYAKHYTERGFLAFNDVPRLINQIAKDDVWDSTLWSDVEYRLDGQVAHWALDEFQDTSEQQWCVLDNVVDEARQDGEKSVFMVGDRKQAIYGWRNGKVGIFIGEVDKSAAPGHGAPSAVYERGELAESRRYRREICAAVNKTCATENDPLKKKSIIEEKTFFTKDAVVDIPWACPLHSAYVKQNETSPSGCVKIVEAEYRHPQKFPDYVDLIYKELEEVRPWEKGYTCAVLVRGNELGNNIAEALKEVGIPAVFEGDSAVLDTPIVSCFVDAVKLADYPGDELAYMHVMTSPIRKVFWNEEMPTSQEVSKKFLEMLTCHGLVRMLRCIKEKLDERHVVFDDFSLLRFNDMMQAAADFEAAMSSERRWSGFEDFLQARKVKQTPDSKKVRIMTIHNSKGLGFDYVILPLPVDDTTSREKNIFGQASADHGEWILRLSNLETMRCNAELADAVTRGQIDEFYEELCLYYVGMTRCKIALTMIEPIFYRKNATDGEHRSLLGRLMAKSGVTNAGDAEWYLKPKMAEATEAAQENAPCAPSRREKVARYAREIPSLHCYEGRSAAEYFFENHVHVSGAERGTQIHELLSQIEWLDATPGVQPTEISSDWVNLHDDSPLRRALCKPEHGLDLWRETAFEYVSEGTWVSGQFDRVVFTEKDGVKLAVIYDFKTNAKQSGETNDAFKARMKETYSDQMEKYRLAVAKLTGIQAENISSILLLTEISDVCPC